jgi:intermediate cleaving peptidase 55
LPNEDGVVAVAADELTPGIPAAEYEQRRRALMDRLPEKSVVVCMAGRIKTMSGNIFYRFRQDSNFLYLTGFQEPDSAVILEKTSDERGYRMTMFVQHYDQAAEVWNGPRTGKEGAEKVFGADEAFDMNPTAFLTHLKRILPSYDRIYVDLPTAPSIPRMTSSRRGNVPSLLNFLAPPSPTAMDNFPKKSDYEMLVKLLGDAQKSHPLSNELHPLRLIKSDNELRLMRRAGRVGSQGMIDVMKSVRAGQSEWQLQTTFESSCAMQGAQRPAYVPVVASGQNALTIHYVQNDDVCRKGQLVCMDAGCELDGYVSDITRAFPVDATFSSPQRDLYEAVLNVLRACTKLVRQDYNYTLSGLHRRSVKMLNGELKRLGFNLPPGGLEKDVYPHALSHWLGLDLHDTSTVDRTTHLRHGMCLSVEPAVYCREGMPGIPHHFWGLGIRIEDDVAVYGDDSNIILNAEAPREIIDVEAACSDYLNMTRQGNSKREEPTLS